MPGVAYPMRYFCRVPRAGAQASSPASWPRPCCSDRCCPRTIGQGTGEDEDLRTHPDARLVAREVPTSAALGLSSPSSKFVILALSSSVRPARGRCGWWCWSPSALNGAAANAFLKRLEEPGWACTFCSLAMRPGVLLTSPALSLPAFPATGYGFGGVGRATAAGGEPVESGSAPRAGRGAPGKALQEDTSARLAPMNPCVRPWPLGIAVPYSPSLHA